MIRFTTNDGQRFTARDYADAVALLHADSRAPCADDQTWMQETARRCSVQTGAEIPTDTPRRFFRALQAHHFVYLLDGETPLLAREPVQHSDLPPPSVSIDGELRATNDLSYLDRPFTPVAFVVPDAVAARHSHRLDVIAQGDRN